MLRTERVIALPVVAVLLLLWQQPVSSNREYVRGYRRLSQVSQKDFFNKLLYDAARTGDVNGVKNALGSGGDIEFTDKEGFTPLLKATSLALLPVLKELGKSGANFTATNKKGENALHIAAEIGLKEIVKYLLRKDIDVDAESTEGMTALHIASREDHEDVAVLLLKKKAKVDSRVAETGDTPLHIASQKGHMSIINVLLKNGADPFARNSKGEQPLHLAAAFAGIQTVSALLEGGADIDSKALNGGNTPLYIAAYYGNILVVEELLKNKADWKAVNNDDLRPDERICGCSRDESGEPCRCFSDEDEEDIEEIFNEVECDAASGLRRAGCRTQGFINSVSSFIG